VVRLALGVRVRDIDYAFKLLRTDFLQHHPLETRGAMINAELLYRLKVSNTPSEKLGFAICLAGVGERQEPICV